MKFKKMLKNIRGSEVVEKILMVIASVALVTAGISFMNKYINNAIVNQMGNMGGTI